MDSGLISRFKEKVYQKSNLHFPPQKTFLFEKRLIERINALRLISYEDYYDLLDKDEKEMENLLDLLTNKETSFFRITNHFEFLRDWLKRKEEIFDPRPSLRIWSAGCSTGEEAYSIAMTILDTLRYPRAWDIEIIATDICYKAIKTALEGRYGLERIKGIPDGLRKYIRTTKDYGEVKEEVKRLVRFERRDIREWERRDFFDLVFCRNVLIYSDLEGQKRVIDSLYRALKPLGYLFTGEGEVLHILPHPFRTIESNGFLLYQKIPSKYEEIIEVMKSGEEDKRLSAIEELGSKKDKESAELLIKAVGDESWRIRKRAIELLSSIEDRYLYPALENALRDNKDASFRNLAMEVFLHLRNRSIRTLISLLKDTDAEIRVFSANILGNIKDPEAVPHLIEALKDEESNVRITSAESLGRIKDKRAIGPLIEALKGDIWLQFSAVTALKEIGDKDAIEPLLSLLASPEIMGIALDAIAAILRRSNYPEDLPSLRDALQREDINNLLLDWLKGNDLGQKDASLILLGWLKDKRALPEMVNLLSDNRFMDLAIETLSLFGKEGIDDIRSYLRDPRIEIRMAIEKILNRIGRDRGLDDVGIVPLMNLISDYSGIYLSKERPINLELRLAPLLLKRGINSLRQYYDYLKAHPEDLPEAVSFIANNETYFFREARQLKILSEHILPEISKGNAGSYGTMPSLRILSTGCSTGEEAYTIGILIEESGLFRNWRIDIIGIDIDREAIEKARRAYYTARSFRVMDQNLLWKYFIRRGNGFIVREEIRKMTRFIQANILNPPSIGRFDIVFCKNLIIYFTEDAIQKTASILYELLREGGYLLLGSSESLSRFDHKFKMLRYPGAVVYKK